MNLNPSLRQFPQISGRQQSTVGLANVKPSDITVSVAPSKFNFEELQEIFSKEGLTALIAKLQELNIAYIKDTDAQTGNTTVTVKIDGVEHEFTGAKSDTVTDKQGDTNSGSTAPPTTGASNPSAEDLKNIDQFWNKNSLSSPSLVKAQSDITRRISQTDWESMLSTTFMGGFDEGDSISLVEYEGMRKLCEYLGVRFCTPEEVEKNNWTEDYGLTDTPDNRLYVSMMVSFWRSNNEIEFTDEQAAYVNTHTDEFNGLCLEQRHDGDWVIQRTRQTTAMEINSGNASQEKFFQSFVDKFASSLHDDTKIATYKTANTPTYNVKLDGDNVVFTDNTVKAIKEWLDRFSPKNPAAGGFDLNDYNYMQIFGLEFGDDEETIKSKLKAFCEKHGSAENMTVSLQDYYDTIAASNCTGSFNSRVLDSHSQYYKEYLKKYESIDIGNGYKLFILPVVDTYIDKDGQSFTVEGKATSDWPTYEQCGTIIKERRAELNALCKDNGLSTTPVSTTPRTVEEAVSGSQVKGPNRAGGNEGNGSTNGTTTSNTNNSGAATGTTGTDANLSSPKGSGATHIITDGASSSDVFGIGTVDNPVLNAAGGNSDILGDFDKTGYDSFVNSIIETWTDTIPLHNGIFDYNVIANLLTMCANGTEIHDLKEAVLHYAKDGKVSDPGNIVDFSQQFMERFINIILNDDEVKNASLSNTTDGGPKGVAISNAIARFLEKFGATKDSDGNYTNLDFNKVANYVLEYDDIPYTSPIYGIQFNSLKEEIEYFRTNGVTEYNENTKDYFKALAHYNSEFFDDYEWSTDAHPYDYFDDVMRLMKLPVSGSTSYEDLVDKQVNQLILFLQKANERGLISRLYSPTSSWYGSELVAPYLRVGIDSGNNITITDDSIKCVQKYLDTLKSKGINPSNDEYCKIFGFTLDDDTETIKQKLNQLYSTMDCATQDSNGNYKVPIKSYYTTLSSLGAHCYDGLDYREVGQGYNCDAISLFSKDQLDEVVERMNMRDKVHNTIVDYGFTIEDIYYMIGGHRGDGQLETNSNDLTVLTGKTLLNGIKYGANSKYNQELVNALFRAAGINADSDSTETQVQKMQQLIDKWFDKDGSISPEKLLVLLTGVDGGECYVKQNTYSAKLVEAFCMQNNGFNYDYQYNIDEWFEQLADGSYILKPGKSLDTSTDKLNGTNRTLVNSIYDIDPNGNLKHAKEVLDFIAKGEFSQAEINAIIQGYQYDHFMKYFYDDLVALYGTPSTETPSAPTTPAKSAPSNKTEETPAPVTPTPSDEQPEVTIKVEDCLKEMDAAASKLNLSASKSQGVYYQFAATGSYLYIWDPVEKKFKAFSINSRNADGTINQEFTQTGRAVNRTAQNIYYEAILEAYKNGYNFTVNFPWICEKDGVYYEYDKEKGCFHKKETK